MPPGPAGDEYISENAPVKVLPTELGADEGTRFVHAACGRNHTLLVGSDGNVWAAGANSLAQVCGLLAFSSGNRRTHGGGSADNPSAVKSPRSSS